MECILSLYTCWGKELHEKTFLTWLIEDSKTFSLIDSNGFCSQCVCYKVYSSNLVKAYLTIGFNDPERNSIRRDLATLLFSVYSNDKQSLHFSQFFIFWMSKGHSLRLDLSWLKVKGLKDNSRVSKQNTF